MTTKTITYSVHSSGELAAGLRGYTDQITVNIDSGDPGGDEGEFAGALRTFLAEWYDGANVVLEKD